MDEMAFQKRIAQLFERHEKFVSRKNERVEEGNGIFDRWKHPVITAHHTPVYWRYDLEYHTKPHLMERLGVNAAFNAGAIDFNGKICLVVRVEGADLLFLSDEHASIILPPDSELAIGDRIMLNPSHIDPTINLHDVMYALEDDWPVTARGYAEQRRYG